MKMIMHIVNIKIIVQDLYYAYKDNNTYYKCYAIVWDYVYKDNGIEFMLDDSIGFTLNNSIEFMLDR